MVLHGIIGADPLTCQQGRRRTSSREWLTRCWTFNCIRLGDHNGLRTASDSSTDIAGIQGWYRVLYLIARMLGRWASTNGLGGRHIYLGRQSPSRPRKPLGSYQPRSQEEPEPRTPRTGIAELNTGRLEGTSTGIREARYSTTALADHSAMHFIADQDLGP